MPSLYYSSYSAKSGAAVRSPSPAAGMEQLVVRMEGVDPCVHARIQKLREEKTQERRVSFIAHAWKSERQI